MAAPDYYRQYAAAPAVAPAPRRSAYRPATKPDVHVVPGRRTAATPTMPSNAALIAAVVAVVLIVFTLLSFARVAISSATIAEGISTQEINSSLEDARTVGNQLEVSQSVLSNATSIKAQAQAMGMTAPAELGSLVLEQDVVAQDDQGNISLSESIRRASALSQD